MAATLKNDEKQVFEPSKQSGIFQMLHNFVDSFCLVFLDKWQTENTYTYLMQRRR